MKSVSKTTKIAVGAAILAVGGFSGIGLANAAQMSSTQQAEVKHATPAIPATQLGRAIGLQGRFEEADALLDSIDGDEPTVAVRVLLERGRVLNSSGRPEMAVPLFEQAAELADHLGEEFLAVDALHMLAIADAAHAETWTRSALEYASTVHDPRTKRWMVALHNNLGWTLYEAGRCTEAMVEFQLAEQWAERVGTPRQQELAREAIKAC